MAVTALWQKLSGSINYYIRWVATDELLLADPTEVLADFMEGLAGEEDGAYERGVRAFLRKDEDGEYYLSFTRSKDNYYEGIFYKEIGTDFNNGIFKFASNGKTSEVRIADDQVTKPIDMKPNLKKV